MREITFTSPATALSSIDLLSGSMDYRIENDRIIITLVGTYSIGEMLDLTRAALDDPAARIPARILVDASASKTVRNQREIEQVAETVSNWKDEIAKIAVFVNSELHFGAMRMSTALSKFSSFDVAPFRSLDAALEFLSQE